MLRQIGDRQTEAAASMHLSEIYFHQEDYKKALKVAYSVNPLLQMLEAHGMAAVNWRNIARFHSLLQESDQAQIAWSNAYKAVQEIQDTNLIQSLKELWEDQKIATQTGKS